MEMDEGDPPQESSLLHPGHPSNYDLITLVALSQAARPKKGTHARRKTRSLHEAPGKVLCPHCRQTVITKTKYVNGPCTWFSCVVFFFIGCVLFSCLPFCFDYYKDVEHHCPNCHQLIYVYKRMK